MPQPQGRLAFPPPRLVSLALTATLTACNGARHDELPVVVLDASAVDAATDAPRDVVRPDAARADAGTDVRADAAADAVPVDAGADALDAGEDAAADAFDAGEDALDAGADTGPAGDAGDDVLDAGDDVLDAGDDALDEGDDALDAAEEEASIPPGPPLIQVMLSWDGAGDLDLHLHNGNATPWFTFNDTWSAQPMPSWGLPGPDDDGWLFSQNDTGYGPEWAQVQSPHPGERYVVGVHNVAGAEGRVATIQIWCGQGGVQVPFTMVSHALAGADASGGCNGNEFWVAAQVVLDGSGACNPAVIDRYETANEACATVP